MLDSVDPEFKEMVVDHCRQFNRDVIKENFILKETIAAMGGADKTLVERMEYFCDNYPVDEVFEVSF